MREVDIDSIPTCQLFEELRKREGVLTINVDMHRPYTITVGEDDDDQIVVEETGVATILVITD